ncbi:Translocase of chloroplast 159, chloroplastic, variant 2 [Trebouxia sp. C0010 RCD-2024]
MSEVPEDIGPEEFHDTTSESDDNVSLSDPGSDTDVGDTGSEEDFVATDRVAEEVYKDPQPESDADSAHAAQHDQEVEAYMERSRSQAVPGRLPSLPDLPQLNFARHGEVMDDTDIEPAEEQTDITIVHNGHSTSADVSTQPQVSASETVVGDNGHSSDADVNPDVERIAVEQPSASGPTDSAQNTDTDTAASNAESASGQEQPAEVPALTAETQPDAVLPSIEAVNDASYASSVQDSEPEYESIPEPEPEPEPQPELEPESESLPDLQRLSEPLFEQEIAAAQPSEAADSDGDTARAGIDLDADIAQPAATRADFAEIQKVLGQAVAQGSNGSTESHNNEAMGSAPDSAPEDEAADTTVEDADTKAAVGERADSGESEAAAQTDTLTQVQQVQSEAQDSPDNAEDAESASDSEDDASDSAPELARDVAASGAGATASSSPERPPAGGVNRLPSLPVRRGTPSLPSRNISTSTATEQPKAEPESVAPSGNGAPSRAKPTAPVANNGHAETAAPSGNGHATSSSAPTSSTTPAAKPASGSSNLAGRPSGPAAPSMPPRPPGSANPSIPPRQPAAASTAPTPAVQPAGNGQPDAAAAVAAATPDDEPAEHRELREKVQNFRVLLVQLTMRLGQSMRGSIVQQVNYRLDLAERIRIPQTNSSARRSYGFETAIRTAEGREAAQPGELLPFSCTVMVMGMTGVGKSATINSVLDEDEASPTNAFEPATRGIKEINGTVAGVRVKFIDTPGLQPSAANIGSNQRLLNQMHRAFKKHKPDIMLYMDRADVYRTDMADVPLLRAITETFGPNMWFNTIVALTHAAAAPPDGNAGPLTYDTYTRSCTTLLQQKIRHACGDSRLLNPVALVENHPACRKNEKGWGILPNQLVWKPHLILLLLSSKLLAQTDSLLKIQQNGDGGRNAQAQAMRMLLGGSRKMPPIPYLIANFIQKKSPRKHPDEERQFKHNSELKDLTVMERKEQMRLRREYSRMRSDDAKAEAGASQTGTPAPDIPLQPTFDAENNSHRYRYMEPPPDAALCRPVMEPNGFDHDDGMNAFSVDKSTVIRKRGVYVGGAPAFLMAQVQKDRDMFSVVVSSFFAWLAECVVHDSNTAQSPLSVLEVISLCCVSCKVGKS